MYPITNEVKALFEAEQRKVLRITGTDKNGATITITDNNVIEDSFQIDRYSCNGEKLEIGTAVAAQMSLTLENGSGQYNGIVFEGAELFVEVGIADWTQSSPTVHWVPCGYFTPDEQLRRLSTISITALDRMMRFDAVPPILTPWTTSNGDVMTTDSGETLYFVSNLSFPTTVAQLVRRTAIICNVPFTQDLSGFPNSGVIIDEITTPLKEITYRNIIQWCAGIMGGNAWIDWTGALRFSWYDNATGYFSTIDNRYSSDLYENDLTVTGVMYTTTGGVIIEGTDDYALDLTGNALTGPIISTILSPLNTALSGFIYRPFTAAVVNAPYLWPMDVVTFTDKDGNDHTSALTNVAFGLNGTTALESKGMTYAINKAAQPNGFTKGQELLVNQAMEQVETNIDESLTQQEIFNRLTDNGAAQGVILYNGQLYINASYIKAGQISVGLIDFTNYDDYEFLVPNEYDATTLFPGQSIVDGWITQTNNTITVVECNNATALQGKRIVVSVETKTFVSGGSTDYATLEGGGSEVWGAPAYGQEDAEGNLIGATGQGEFYRYETSWVVPDDATWFSISFDTAGARAIRVSADTASDFAFMYGNNVAISYKGLQVGKFVVDKTGNVTSSGRNQFDGDVDINGELSLNGNVCSSGSFTTADGKTVTVTNGLITEIV